MTLIAVYGTLMEGQGNWNWAINPQKTIERIELPGWEMMTCGGFPGCRPTDDKNKTIQVDLFDVTDAQLARIDNLEGYNPEREHNGFYERMTVETPHGEAFIYKYNGDWYEDRVLEDGKWLNVGMHSFWS